MPKKILILSDSVSLARESPEKTNFYETWPELLKKHDFEIHQVSIGGATSTELLRQIQYHKVFYPDIVIIQCGIVDCAPRFASKLEIDLLKKIPLVGHKILNKINSPKIRNKRKITYTNPIQFKRNLTAIDKSFDSNTFFLTIIPADEKYSKALPGIKENIEKFNTIIKQHRYVDLQEIPKQGIMSDHHHLNKIGHKYIYHEILKFLSLQNDGKERT